MSDRRKYTVSSKKQMAALAPAVRLEIVDALAEMGTVSVAEIAATLGRPADALYYHLRVLQEVGLVVQSGYQRKGMRKEALYRTIAPELWLRYEPCDDSNRQGVTAIVRSILRLGVRDFERAFKSGVVVKGPRREIWALRKAGRLSLSGLSDLNKQISRLKDSMSHDRRGGKLYAMTVVLVPIDRQRKSPIKK